MPAAQDLQNDALAFMSKNIVVINGLNPTESNWQATTQFSLLDSATAWGMAIPGVRKTSVLKRVVNSNVYLLSPYNNDPTTLVTAYWCGYRDDSVKVQMLGNLSTLMFTHRMDGCTFGIGSPDGNGNVTVGHFNIQLNGRTDETLMRDSAKIMLGNNVTLLEKSRYFKDDNNTVGVCATTFGEFRGGQWKFYHQRYRDHNNGYKLIDVRKIR